MWNQKHKWSWSWSNGILSVRDSVKNITASYECIPKFLKEWLQLFDLVYCLVTLVIPSLTISITNSSSIHFRLSKIWKMIKKAYEKMFFICKSIYILKFYLTHCTFLLSKAMCGICRFSISIFAQQKAWTLWLKNVIIPFKFKVIEKSHTEFCS